MIFKDSLATEILTEMCKGCKVIELMSMKVVLTPLNSKSAYAGRNLLKLDLAAYDPKPG